MKTINESKAQIEVWEWKEKAAKEVEAYSIKEALEISIANSILIMEKLGLHSDTAKIIGK
jgi:hypothetical protein